MAPSIKLTYFDIEGVAESVRLALILSGTEFEDDRVPHGKWPELKPTTPYGQLPIMTIDNGPVHTQSGAMLRWVGANLGDKQLYPPDKLFEIEEAIGLTQDLINSWTPNIYVAMRPGKFGHPEDYAKTDEGKAVVESMRKKWIAEELPRWLGFFSDMIDKNSGKWLVEGENPTIADCLFVPTIRAFTKGHIDHVDTKCLEICPKIVAYVERFCALPGVEGRYSSGLGASN